MKIAPINILHTLIIWQSILFAIILITPKYNKRRENKFLALLLLTLGIHFSYNIFLTNQLFVDVLPQYSCSYGFLYGPLLFLYIRFHFHKDLYFKPIAFLHFVPFTTVILLNLMGYKICNIVMHFVLPVMLTYCLFSFIETFRYKKILAQVSSNSDYSELKWIYSLLIVQIIILNLNFLHLQFDEILLFNFKIPLEPIVQLLILILVNIMIYQGLKNPHFFQKISNLDVAVTKKSNSNEKLNVKALTIISLELEKHMKENKPFLNPELNLNTLAEDLKVHPKTLSQTINQILGSNFSEYINSYRMEEAKLLLKKNEDKNTTIMEIMYQVGFNSRSVFNTTFKNITGVTPSRYRDNN